MDQSVMQVFLEHGLLGAIIIVLAGVVAYLAKKTFALHEALRQAEIAHAKCMIDLMNEAKGEVKLELEQRFVIVSETNKVLEELRNTVEILTGRLNGRTTRKES